MFTMSWMFFLGEFWHFSWLPTGWISGDLSELQGDFALNQLESDLGGTRELETNFFPFPLPPGPVGTVRWTN